MNLAPETALRHYFGQVDGPQGGWSVRRDAFSASQLEAVLSRDEETAAIADDYAHGLIRQGRADTVLVVCADEVGGARAHVLSGEPLCVS